MSQPEHPRYRVLEKLLDIYTLDRYWVGQGYMYIEENPDDQELKDAIRQAENRMADQTQHAKYLDSLDRQKQKNRRRRR